MSTPNPHASLVALNRALQYAKDNHGFLTMFLVDVIAHHDKLRQVLVRCNGGRFLCPAQDVRHFMDIIDKEKSDWVRDVSLPTTDPIWKAAA